MNNMALDFVKIDLTKLSEFIPTVEEFARAHNTSAGTDGMTFYVEARLSNGLPGDTMSSSTLLSHSIEIITNPANEVVKANYNNDFEQLQIFFLEGPTTVWYQGMNYTIEISSDQIGKWYNLYQDYSTGMGTITLKEKVKLESFFSPSAIENIGEYFGKTYFDTPQTYESNGYVYEYTLIQSSIGVMLGGMGSSIDSSVILPLTQSYWQTLQMTEDGEGGNGQPGTSTIYSTDDLLTDIAKIIQDAEGDKTRKIRGVDMPVRLRAIIGGGSGGSATSSEFDIRSYNINKNNDGIYLLQEVKKGVNYKLRFNWSEIYKNMKQSNGYNTLDSDLSFTIYLSNNVQRESMYHSSLSESNLSYTPKLLSCRILEDASSRKIYFEIAVNDEVSYWDSSLSTSLQLGYGDSTFGRQPATIYRVPLFDISPIDYDGGIGYTKLEALETYLTTEIVETVVDLSFNDLTTECNFYNSYYDSAMGEMVYNNYFRTINFTLNDYIIREFHGISKRTETGDPTNPTYSFKGIYLTKE